MKLVKARTKQKPSNHLQKFKTQLHKIRLMNFDLIRQFKFFTKQCLSIFALLCSFLFAFSLEASGSSAAKNRSKTAQIDAHSHAPSSTTHSKSGGDFVSGWALGFTPKYREEQSFSYVDPKTPKGGLLRLPNLYRTTGFDSFNPFVLKGISATYLSDLIFESLATTSADEVGAIYGLIAQGIEVFPQLNGVRFELNPKAKFSNGDPILADDVLFSYHTLTSSGANPSFRVLFADVAKVSVESNQHIRFEFKNRNPDLILTISGLPIFSRKWLQGKTIDQIDLQKPIASGPYEIEKYQTGQYLVYKRRTDYWAAQHPKRLGMFNFDQIRVSYYKDDLAKLEAFKSGAFDYLVEFRAKNWARLYQGRLFDQNVLSKKTFDHQNVQGMQGFIFNTRRPQLRDIRVRKALGLALDFDWLNRQLFYRSYEPSLSFWNNSELSANQNEQGSPPSADEKTLLKAIEQQTGQSWPDTIWGNLPERVTTQSPSSLRLNLKKARSLFAEAGWFYQNGKLINAKGEIFRIEFLSDSSGAGSFARIMTPLIKNLQQIGVQVSERVVDFSLYQKRLENFDFDIVSTVIPASLNPGNELRDTWGSQSASTAGSDNLAGIADRNVDALIQKIVQANQRSEMITATRVLDRWLLHHYAVIPQWTNRVYRIGFHHNIAPPKMLPKYYRAETWPLWHWSRN